MSTIAGALVLYGFQGLDELYFEPYVPYLFQIESELYLEP